MTCRPIFLYSFSSLSLAHLFALALEAGKTKPTEDTKGKKKGRKTGISEPLVQTITVQNYDQEVDLIIHTTACLIVKFSCIDPLLNVFCDVQNTKFWKGRDK